MHGARATPGHTVYPFVSWVQHLGGPNHPHPVIVAISDIDIPLLVHVTSMRPVQAGSDRRSRVAHTAPAPPGDRRDHASHRVNAANGVIFGIHDQEIAVVVTPNGLGRPPGGGYSRPPVTTVATLPSASVCRHDPVRVNLADAIAFPFTDVGVALVVHAHSPRPFSSAGKGSDDPSTQIPTPDPLVLHVSNEKPAATIEETIVGLTQLR